MIATQFPTVAICGSMRYFPAMIQAAGEYTANGWIVLMPFSVAEEGSAGKEMLDEMHRTKIDMSERIVVIGDHIGESTSAEIKFAYEHKIEVVFRSVSGFEAYVDGKPASR